jgi:hypothetical protein
MNAKNRIMIYGPKPDGTHIVEFRIANGEALAISVPAGETRVLKYFQSECPTNCSCRTFNEELLGCPNCLPNGAAPPALLARADQVIE